jgi:hypothetical protein
MSTLEEELTALPEPFPVNSSLTDLLKIVAHNACRANRNLHSAYLVVSRARDVCNEIHSLAENAGEGDSWDNFKMYTQMIISLEGYPSHPIRITFIENSPMLIEFYWILTHWPRTSAVH